MRIEPGELRCKACGAALHYEPRAAVIKCAYCGTEYTLDTPLEGVIEFTGVEAEAEEAAAAEPDRPAYEGEALSWLRAGDSVRAVEAVRESTGWDLRESTEYVEALAAREGIWQPEGYTTLIIAILIGIGICFLVGFLPVLVSYF